MKNKWFLYKRVNINLGEMTEEKINSDFKNGLVKVVHDGGWGISKVLNR